MSFLSSKCNVDVRCFFSILLFVLVGNQILSDHHSVAFSVHQSIHHRYRYHPNIATSSTRTSSMTTLASPLHMGIMEDFLTGQDNGIRIEDNRKYLESLQQRVDKINKLEATIEILDDEELQLKTIEFRQRIQNNNEDINGPLLEEAFAVVREASWRVLELRHYDVQLIGGMILNDGRLAEMKTGEGKTLVSTLPVYLQALRGKTSFVITVNDYLARRDMERMGQIYKFLGLSVGLIQSYMTPEQRQIQYAKDIVFVTNAELGFDYLRDHLALSYDQTVLLSSINKNNDKNNNENKNGFLNDCYCVVDEADSIFIDEARTPLIISQQVPAPATKYFVANQLANALKNKIHYKVDLKNKNIIMTDVGYQDSENALRVNSIFTLDSTGEAWAPFIMNAIKAKELFNKDIEYTVLKDNTGQAIGVGIIDAFTGRVLDGRRWSDGLHQSIEAMENITISSQSKVIAKITYQALFRQLFGKNKLSGMTGTAMSDATELETIYGLKVTPVPTALPIARRDYPDVAFKTRKGANDALIQEVISVGGGNYDNGRPCLIGTTSIAQSEMIVKALAENGIEAELLNASPQNAPRESEIIAQAGRVGVVTVATNMAGRGTDILLGGCSRTMSRIKTRCVLVENNVLKKDNTATAIFPSSPPDESYFPCDLDDDIQQQLINAAEAIKSEFPSLLTEMELDEILTIAFDTTEADDDPTYIIELRNAADSIKELYNEVLTEEKEIVKNLGGLYVIGTNRHESSRIDQQLRGRAGRQGDPGSSRFFVSFEDDMFVIFGGTKLQSLLSTFRVAENMPIESKQISDTLNKVQQQVEEKYRSIRNEIFRFDEVLNQQRNVIYNRRNKILTQSSSGMIQLFQSYNEDTVREIVVAQTNSETGEINYDKIVGKLHQFFPPSRQFIRVNDIIEKGMDTIIAYVTIVIDEIFQENQKSLKSLDKTSNYITLVTMDNAWSDHLQSLENLKEAVVLRSYQGRDPISEYEKEAFILFQGLEDTMRRNAVYSLWQSFTPQRAAAPVSN